MPATRVLRSAPRRRPRHARQADSLRPSGCSTSSGTIPAVPGAIGAFRREALAAVGRLSSQTLAEDTDLTMAVCRPPITMRHECALLSA